MRQRASSKERRSSIKRVYSGDDPVLSLRAL